MSKVFDMHAKTLAIGDEIDIPCKVIAIHEFEVGHAQVTVKTLQPRAGTKEYTTFTLNARQVARSRGPGRFKTKTPKLCRSASAIPRPASAGAI